MSTDTLPVENFYQTTAKPDSDGYVDLLVRCGDQYVPMKGKLKELQKDDFSDFIEMEEFESFEENVQEACRINLTKWVLKDNPEVANRIGKYADDQEYVLYWNGAEGAWKFYETLEWEPIYISEDDLSDDDMKWLESFADENADSFYGCHYDRDEQYGDESIHAVYESICGIGTR